HASASVHHANVLRGLAAAPLTIPARGRRAAAEKPLSISGVWVTGSRQKGGRRKNTLVSGVWVTLARANQHTHVI
ncbi:hypothetical protein, partial [Franconibacter helveticus]|uniref:hypothetical protein n=1 Tax=Franconibacter helveticus TaxID=357240 RepID=UPI00290DB70F